MRIRAFELGDYDAALALWSAAEHLGPVPLDEVEKKLTRDAQLFLVAEDDGQLVGIVMGSTDGRRGWIFRLAVDPTRRTEGIGRALITELEGRFLEIGITRVNLMVVRDNIEGTRFWERLGWSPFDDAVLYSKQLDVAPAPDEGAC